MPRSLLTVFAASLLAAACGSGGGGGSSSAAGGTPERGGVLQVIGSSDVDHMATTSAYYTVTNGLFRTFTRQLVTNPTDRDYDVASSIVADLAREVPSKDNGGISEDGTVYTFHLRSGVRWNTDPPRAFVAGDEVRGLKMLCNPVSPVGAPGYYEFTIDGMQEYCDRFAKVEGTPAAIKRFVESNDIRGVRAPDDSTVVINLLGPNSDFLNIMSMPFASPVPVEYLDYLPDGADFRNNTISIGPYQIRSYQANRGIDLGRNPAWDPATDPVRNAWVDSIHVVEGVNAQSVQQQLQAGTADISWDQAPPTADLASLIALDDPNLILGPPGPHYVINEYIPINFQAKGPLQELKVRQALEYAVDRMAVAQIMGGPKVARPLTQAVVVDAAGGEAGYDPYPTPDNHGDPVKAKELLAEAGYPDGIDLKLLYRTNGTNPQVAQTVQASLAAAGIRTQLIPSTGSDFYAKYLQNPDAGKRGEWDIAVAAWVPDWFGNNGRSMIQALFDGRTYGPNSTNYGDYNSPVVNRAIDAALAAPSADSAMTAWRTAAQQVMKDAGMVPLIEGKEPLYHADRVRNCVFSLTSFNCDFTVLWLNGAGPRTASNP